MEARIEELKSYEELIAEAQQEAEAIKDELKREMMERDAEELVCGKYILRYQNIISQKFNMSEFKKMYSDLYKVFLRQSNSKRFSIA